MESLKTRLSGRGTDTDTSLAKRLATAIEEIKYAQTGAHDLIIINDNLDTTYDKFRRVALGEVEPGDSLPQLLEE